MKSYEYLLIDDGRPEDDWGRPIGKSYEKKDWEQLTPEEMAADFEWKSDILASFGDEVSCATFYQDYLFHELYTGELGGSYKVLVTEYDAEAGSKVHKVDVDELDGFLQMSDVALSPCLFHGNWRNKQLLNYVGAFVLDIDKLRPKSLQRFFRLFEEGRLLWPTFIANSGSGVHFYYVLDKMLKVDSVQNEANRMIAEAVYRKLYDDVIKKEKWVDAQRHWIGQDYRVVNSKTKLHLTSQIFKVGEIYTIEQLMEHFDIKVDREKRYASKAMVKYAGNIAKDLGIEPPDYSDAKVTYDFIRENKDEAYTVRKARRDQRNLKKSRKAKSSSKPVTWYRNTLNHMYDHTMAGYRFSSMKALAIIAFKEQVPKDLFIADIRQLSAYWEAFDWKGDDFNPRNVEAIERLFDNAVKYSNTTAETLEEWLGYEFRKIGVKRNGRSQNTHLKLARANKAILKELGEMKPEGRPKGSGTEAQKVAGWRILNPEGRKADCIRETGLSKPTVYKWWDEPFRYPEALVIAAEEANMTVEDYLKEVGPSAEDMEKFKEILELDLPKVIEI